MIAGEWVEQKARAGLEPANDGFANHCLSQLGDRALYNCYTAALLLTLLLTLTE